MRLPHTLLRNRSHSRVKGVTFAVVIALIALSVAGCSPWKAIPTPFAPTATPVAALPGAIQLSPVVTHLKPTVTMTGLGTITQYHLPIPPISRTYTTLPRGLAAGPHGVTWFAEVLFGVIGSLTASGVLTTYTLPLDGGMYAPHPEKIAEGRDGAAWFTLREGDGKSPDRIGRLTPNGALNEFPLPAPYGTPEDIVAGADGGLWFLEQSHWAIGRISTSGIITEFPIPSVIRTGVYGLAAGPDGAIWFSTAFQLGRLSTDGAYSLFFIPSAYWNQMTAGAGIVTGPDGTIWYAGVLTSRIGRFVPPGDFAQFATPTANARPMAMCAGLNGSVWFTESYANKIGRITPSGDITEIPIPLPYEPPSHIPRSGVNTGPSAPTPTTTSAGGDLMTDIILGSDGVIWFIQQQSDLIGRLA